MMKMRLRWGGGLARLIPCFLTKLSLWLHAISGIFNDQGKTVSSQRPIRISIINQKFRRILKNLWVVRFLPLGTFGNKFLAERWEAAVLAGFVRNSQSQQIILTYFYLPVHNKKRSRGYHLQAKRTVLKVMKPQATYSASSGGFSSTRKTQFIRMVRITNDSKYLESELRKMNLLQTPI